MKRLLLLLMGGGMLLGGSSLKAQSDVSTNFLGAIFGNYGIHYEYVLNEGMGVGAQASFYNHSVSFGDSKHTWSGFTISPDVRIYFSPDDDAEGFFASPYVRFASRKSIGWYYIDSQGNEQNDGVKKYTGLAGGLIIGKKWVANSGFILETFIGVGKYFVESEEWSPEDARVDWEGDGVESSFGTLDFRLGLAIGWRFGG